MVCKNCDGFKSLDGISGYCEYAGLPVVAEDECDVDDTARKESEDA